MSEDKPITISTNYSPKLYRIAASEYLGWLVMEVNEYIAKGYEPIGGVSASAFMEGRMLRTLYDQAMLLPETGERAGDKR